MIRLNLVVKPALQVPAELLVLPLCEDIRPVKGFVGRVDWWFNGQISRLYKSRKFFGAIGQRALTPCVHWLPFDKLVMLGVGMSGELSYARIVEVHKALPPVLKSLKAATVTMMGSCPDVRSMDDHAFVLALVEGLVQGIAECGDKLPLSRVNIAVEEVRKPSFMGALKPLVERYREESGLRLDLS